jgi:hypothetical protein
VTIKKCEATNREGERCHFNGSKQVGHLWLCGNHAAKQLKAQPIEIIEDNNIAAKVAAAIDRLYTSNLGTIEVTEAILRKVIEENGRRGEV